MSSVGRPKKQPMAVVNGLPLWRCSKCGEPLAASRFSPSHDTSNGLNSWCKRCCRDNLRAKRRARLYANPVYL